MAGTDDIAAERLRQITVEGYDSTHDDGHTEGEIALAACCYASPDLLYLKEERENVVIYKDPWPWGWGDDKRPSTGSVPLPNRLESLERRRRLLVIAGAMIAAEIDRIDRMMRP